MQWAAFGPHSGRIRAAWRHFNMPGLEIRENLVLGRESENIEYFRLRQCVCRKLSAFRHCFCRRLKNDGRCLCAKVYGYFLHLLRFPGVFSSRQKNPLFFVLIALSVNQFSICRNKDAFSLFKNKTAENDLMEQRNTLKIKIKKPRKKFFEFIFFETKIQCIVWNQGIRYLMLRETIFSRVLEPLNGYQMDCLV